MAEEDSKSLEEKEALYQKAVMAGERKLGEDYFEKHKGHFWGLVETRPFMRALAELAGCQWILGKSEKAISNFKYMLELNPGDNQGIRFTLLSILLAEGKDKETEEIIEKHCDNDCVATFLYSKVLLEFRKEGNTEKTRNLLDEALKGNSHVPSYLLGVKKIPEKIPGYIKFGGVSEAIHYVLEGRKAWQKTKGVMQWLANNVDDVKSITFDYKEINEEGAVVRIDNKIGRNDPCHCGSGKKYKKCCGR